MKNLSVTEQEFIDEAWATISNLSVADWNAVGNGMLLIPAPTTEAMSQDWVACYKHLDKEGFQVRIQVEALMSYIMISRD